MTTETVDEAKVEKAIELWFTKEQQRRSYESARKSYRQAETSLNYTELGVLMGRLIKLRPKTP